MKKFINEPGMVVPEMIDGMLYSKPELKRVGDLNCIMDANAPYENQVALISFGGSGHEPAHAGYIRPDGLTGVALGDVFSSPSVEQIYEVAKACDGGAGILFIAKNYTGDLLNSEMAMEMLISDGFSCDRVVVNDDVSVKNSTWTTGRRGVAGTIFVHRITGCYSNTLKASLAEVKAMAEHVIDNVRTMGVGLCPCIIPAVGHPRDGWVMGDNEMEVGIGIHGEPGIRRGDLKPANLIVDDVLQMLVKDLGLNSGDKVAVMVNGMGATPLMELYILYKDAYEWLDSKGIQVFERGFVGEYMTSLEMAGASITILKTGKRILDFLPRDLY